MNDRRTLCQAFFRRQDGGQFFVFHDDALGGFAGDAFCFGGNDGDRLPKIADFIFGDGVLILDEGPHASIGEILPGQNADNAWH